MHKRLPIRWAVIIIVGVIIVCALTVLTLTMLESHQETYTNAWYVFSYES